MKRFEREMHKIKMSRIGVMLAATGIGLAYAASAHAGFVDETASTPAAVPSTASAPDITVRSLGEVWPAASGQIVTQTGSRPKGVSIPRGKGHDIALSDMLPAIVPQTFTIDLGNVDRQQTAAWHGGQPWDRVLGEALSPLGNVEATIDWDRHIVALRHVSSISTAAGTPATAATPAAIPPVTPAPFALVAGQSFETQMQEWAKRAGWAVVWNTPDDWIVPHDSTYGLDFESAVKSVFDQMGDDGADVRADIWKGNKSVVVDKAGAQE